MLKGVSTCSHRIPLLIYLFLRLFWILPVFLSLTNCLWGDRSTFHCPLTQLLYLALAFESDPLSSTRCTHNLFSYYICELYCTVYYILSRVSLEINEYSINLTPLPSLVSQNNSRLDLSHFNGPDY